MSIIDKRMKMAEVIHHDYTLLPVISRFGITLGFGDLTVEEICEKNDVDADFFVEILSTFHDAAYFPKERLQSFSAGIILQYLIKTHEYYLSNEIPEIENLINRLIKSCYIEKNNMKLLEDFFDSYKQDLFQHIQRENEVTYPYVKDLEYAVNKSHVPEGLKEKMNTYSILDFANEHDNVEEKLFDIKNIIIKYLPPAKDNQLYNSILFKLFEFEKDLNDHARLEDEILIPVAIQLETKALNL